MDALERRQIGTLYRIEGRRLARATEGTATISQPSELEDARSPSRRELAVLQLVADGLSNREIGGCLSISEGTVQSHIKNLLDKLAARNRAHAASIGIRRDLIS
jgi:DNA-binding NarL/FixJ family response regulator